MRFSHQTNILKSILNWKKIIKHFDRNFVQTKINRKYSISYLNAFLCSRTNYSSDRSFFIKREQHTGLYILDYDVPTLNVTIIYKRRIAWYIYSIAATSRLNNFCGIQGEQIKSEEGTFGVYVWIGWWSTLPEKSFMLSETYTNIAY